MLQVFRDKSQSTFIQAIVLVIALVFIFWGVGANMMDNREAAIVVNGDEISFQKYQRLYDQVLSNYRQKFGGAVPDKLLKSLGLSQQVKGQLIQQALLRQGSVEMGLRISIPEVQRRIQEMVQFQEGDSFNMGKYKAILSSNRLTPHKYELSQQTDLLASKGVQAIGDFATTVTEAEINDLYQQAKERITVGFTKISPSSFRAQVVIEEQALTNWFQKNKENYTSAPRVKIQFLSFPYSPKPTTEGPSASAARAKVFQAANSAYEGIISSGSLESYGKLYPQVKIRKTSFFSKSIPPADLDQAASVVNTVFSLKAGELSSLIESPAGFTILLAEAIEPPTIPALASITKKVRADYRTERAGILARNKSVELLRSLKEGAILTQLGQQPSLTVQEATLSRSSMATAAQNFPVSLRANIFTLSDKTPLPEEVATVGEDLYLYQFIKRTLPDPTEITVAEKALYSKQLLVAKQERVLIAWLSHQEKAAEIYTSKNID